MSKTPEEYMTEVNQYWIGKTKPILEDQTIDMTPEEREASMRKAIGIVRQIRALLDRINAEMEEDNGKIYE